MSWFKKLKGGLFKTSSLLTSSISEILTNTRLDDQILSELEELLILTDMGVDTSINIIKDLRKEKFSKEISNSEILDFLSNHVAQLLKPVARPLVIKESVKPFVVMVCGVNGNGKTTTIGKLSYKLQMEGKTVMLAACDTFRAAAVEQLEVWAQRSGAWFISGTESEDPASVAYKALDRAIYMQADVLLIDTAGRLHNKSGLMEELAKCQRVLKKLDKNAPHETILVLDATTGQNACIQTEMFKKIVDITGIILTKLDGSANGGIIVSLAQRFALPVYAVGVGEAMEDLNAFSAEEFSKALVGKNI